MPKVTPWKAAAGCGEGNGSSGWKAPAAHPRAVAAPSAGSGSSVVAGRLGRQRLELGGVDRLHDHQPLDHCVQVRALGGEDPLGRLVALLDDVADLLVDERGDLFRVVPLLPEVAAEEDELLL